VVAEKLGSNDITGIELGEEGFKSATSLEWDADHMWECVARGKPWLENRERERVFLGGGKKIEGEAILQRYRRPSHGGSIQLEDPGERVGKK
jgi:hypothetical protein